MRCVVLVTRCCSWAQQASVMLLHKQALDRHLPGLLRRRKAAPVLEAGCALRGARDGDQALMFASSVHAAPCSRSVPHLPGLQLRREAAPVLGAEGALRGARDGDQALQLVYARLQQLAPDRPHHPALHLFLAAGQLLLQAQRLTEASDTSSTLQTCHSCRARAGSAELSAVWCTTMVLHASQGLAFKSSAQALPLATSQCSAAAVPGL